MFNSEFFIKQVNVSEVLDAAIHKYNNSSNQNSLLINKTKMKLII